MHIYYHLADTGTLLEHIAGGAPDSSVLYRLKISQQFAFGKQVFQRFQLAVYGTIISQNIGIFAWA